MIIIDNKRRKWLHRGELIIGLIGASVVTFFGYWLTISFAAGRQADLVEWLLVAAIDLFVFSSIGAAWKWPLAGGVMLTFEGLTLTGWFIQGSIWGIFYVPLGLLLLVSGVIHIQLHNEFSSNSFRSE